MMRDLEIDPTELEWFGYAEIEPNVNMIQAYHRDRNGCMVLVYEGSWLTDRLSIDPFAKAASAQRDLTAPPTPPPPPS